MALALLPYTSLLSPPAVPCPSPELTPFSLRRSLPVRCAKRTGRQRYPSEKRKLERARREKEMLRSGGPDGGGGYWRLFSLAVPARSDPGKDFVGVSPALLEAIAKVLKFPVPSMLPEEAFCVVRKSFDARKMLKEPQFVYIVDMDVQKLVNLEPRTSDFISSLEHKLGSIECLPKEKVTTDLIGILHGGNKTGDVESARTEGPSGNNYLQSQPTKPKIAVVGSGPSGLFASLVLGELGAEVTLIERGQAVEQRGRDIGAMIVRRILQTESNFCFGEGGAGTWSDGKLVTRIGRNSDSVQAVLNTFVHFGAPKNILVDGKPHLGTDRLVPLLQNFRQYLRDLGVTIKFNTRMDDLIVENGRVKGVTVSDARHDTPDGQKLFFDAVVLAVGHSARDVYRMLLHHGANMIPKNFAVGLRIEHPQDLINSIQYSDLAAEVLQGRGRIPVADYKVVNYVDDGNNGAHPEMREQNRSCYSFCMCPGGQVVLTSTHPSELCINGMSFSKRASRWANAALVVNVSSLDFESIQSDDPLAGIEFQRQFERRAAVMGGGNFVVPAQRVTDFLDNKLSATILPPSSYRLGVRASKLHELFPPRITEALQQSILTFDKELPGFISEEALLHGVETRTSAPVQIQRDAKTYESTSMKGLYPIGEGAGCAGGIVSAAVDGVHCGFALAKQLHLYNGDIDSVLGKAQDGSCMLH